MKKSKLSRFIRFCSIIVFSIWVIHITGINYNLSNSNSAISATPSVLNTVHTPSKKPKPPTTASPEASLNVLMEKLNLTAIGANSGGSSGGQINEISCWSVGNCVIGGAYYFGPLGGGNTAFLAQETNGQWGQAFLVPTTANFSSYLQGDDYSDATWVDCPAKGYCSVGGSYNDNLNAICESCYTNAFVVNEVKGKWYGAIAVPGVHALNQGDGADLEVGTCLSVGTCEIGGTYTDNSGNTQLYTDSEKNGIWQIAKPLGDYNGSNSTSFNTMQCSTPQRCEATGTYGYNNFVAILKNGRWCFVSSK